MPFAFHDGMLNEYLQQGYLILRQAIPASLLKDLRPVADQARALAHEINGPQAQRIQPLERFADRLNLKPFQDYCELPDLTDAIRRLLGPRCTYGHLGIMGLLVEPVNMPWHGGWHRDGVVEVPTEARGPRTDALLDEVWHDLAWWNQINCAIYSDSCTWFVPGSHLRRRDLPGEAQTHADPAHVRATDGMSVVEAEVYGLDHAASFPGAVQVHLRPGDMMLYRNLGWHCGNYAPSQPRATIHDVVKTYADSDWGDRWAQAKREAVAQWRERTG